MFKHPLFAMSFLWRIPIKVYPHTERDFQFGLIYFPLVGFLEGLFLFIIAQALLNFIKPMVLALLLILILLIIRGIFHLDGFSDTFDALAYKGNHDIEEDRKKRLEIMKDSTVGVAGVTAIIFLLLSKFVLFKEILVAGGAINLVFPFLLSRVILMFFLFLGKPARQDGLGYLMIKLTTKGIFLLSLLLGFLLLALYLYLAQNLKAIDIFLILLSNLLLLSYFTWLFNKNFGGLTGDNLGALVEISELITLFYLGVLWPRL